MDDQPQPQTVSRHTITALRAMRTWRRWGRAVHLVLLLGTAGAGYLAFTAPPPSISLASYQRIERGMTPAQVGRVVGTRPGGYGTGVLALLNTPVASERWSDAVQGDSWTSEQGWLSVGYGEDGRVCAKALHCLGEVAEDDPAIWPWWKRLVQRPGPGRGPLIITVGPW